MNGQEKERKKERKKKKTDEEVWTKHLQKIPVDLETNCSGNRSLLALTLGNTGWAEASA